MGQREVLSTHQTRETPGEMRVDANNEEPFVLVEVPSTEVADSLHGVNGDGHYLENRGDKLEDIEALLNPQAMELTNTDHAQEMQSSDMSLRKASFEGILNARSQETRKSNAYLNDIFERYEFEFQKKHQENQKLCELILSERESFTTQLRDFHETTHIMKHEIGQLRQDVVNLPAILDDNLATTIVITTGQLFRHNRGLDKDLRKCRIQLESATQDVQRTALERDKLDTDLRECRIQLQSGAQAVDNKTRESDQLKADIALMETANTRQLQRLDKIQQELCKEKEGRHGSYIDGLQTPFVWESVAKEMFSSIGTFNNLLSKYKDSKGNIPARTLIAGSELGIKVRVARSYHWIYLLKNFICSYLFQDFEYETFLTSEKRVLFLDPDERVRECFEYFQKSQKSRNEGSPDRATAPSAKGALLDFLFSNYFSGQIRLLPLEVQHLGSACRQSDELMGTVRNKIQESEIHPDKRRLFDSFISVTKKAWDFHKLCLSFNPPATIFRVSPGDEFNPNYMESIDTVVDNNSLPLVGCMVYPGFRLRKFIIKCQVYPLLKT